MVEFVGGVAHALVVEVVTVDVDDEGLDGVQGGEAAGVVGVGDDGGFDAHFAQGGLHEPVEVGRQHDRHAAGGGGAGGGAVRSSGLLEAAPALLVVWFEVGAQERLPLERGGGERGQEVVVGCRVAEAL